MIKDILIGNDSNFCAWWNFNLHFAQLVLHCLCFFIWRRKYDTARYLLLKECFLSCRLSGAQLDQSGAGLDYHVTSDDSFGRLHCRAVNGVGKQSQPCVFEVMPKGTHTSCSIAYRCHPKYVSTHFKEQTCESGEIVLLYMTVWQTQFCFKCHRDPAKNSCISFSLCREWMQPAELELFLFMHLLLWRHIGWNNQCLLNIFIKFLFF